jgi:prevent-host-death family protein
MTTIGVRELRQHASRWLARVKAGERIVVTERGRAVAELVPISTAAAPGETLTRLVGDGLASPAEGSLLAYLDEAGGPTAGPPLSLRVEQLRAEER